MGQPGRERRGEKLLRVGALGQFRRMGDPARTVVSWQGRERARLGSAVLSPLYPSHLFLAQG